MKRHLLTLIAGAILAVLAVAPAAAAQPDSPNCWGVVSAQRASTTGGLGEHASSQGTPRLGLGNTARLLFDIGLTGGPHVSDLGTTLAMLDGIDATACGS